MEDLSRFSGPVRKSSRLAAYYGKSTGAAAGLAAALARASGTPAPIAARTVPTARTVAPAKPNASTSKPRDRVQIVADAVASDPALKGKAGIAINFLADPAFAGVTGQGIIKLLRAGATTAPPPLATSTAKATAPRKRSDALGGGNAPTAESSASWDRAYDRLFGRKA